VALTPRDCAVLVSLGHTVTVERSNGQRMITDAEYEQEGFDLVKSESWVDAPQDAIIVGIKELPDSAAPLVHTHIMFGHCYKYQTGWQDLLFRFRSGGGMLLDVEFMVDKLNKRVVHEFSPMAGFCGLGVGLDAWCHKILRPDVKYSSVEPYANETILISKLHAQLKEIAASRLHQPRLPVKVMIIGSRGACGTGAREIAKKIGSEWLELTLWNSQETKAGGPFPEILDQDILVNCVYLPSSGTTRTVAPFVDASLLQTNCGEKQRRLSMIVDVSCDPTSVNNPLPIYHDITYMHNPIFEYSCGKQEPVSVIAIDHLPAVLPRESSERYSSKLYPFLNDLDSADCDVWTRCRNLFHSKVNEALWRSEA